MILLYLPLTFILFILFFLNCLGRLIFGIPPPQPELYIPNIARHNRL